jgi:hypothetical protein
LVRDIAGESDIRNIAQRLPGVDSATASYLANETDPKIVESVLHQAADNAGVPIKDWVQSPKLTNQDQANTPTADTQISGTFDASNPPQSFLPPGMHAPNAADPTKVLSDHAGNFKSPKEFEDYVNSLSGEDKAVAESALNGKSAAEFYQAVHGEGAGTVLHLPDQGVHAQLTPNQAAVLADEQKHIPFTATDRPHLTAGGEVLKRTQEVTPEELASMSPNAKKALENAQAEIDKAANTASPNTTPAALLPAKATGPIRGEGFSMTDQANPDIIKAGKRLSKLDQQIHDIQQGKVSATADEARALTQERQDLIDQVNSGQFTPKPASAPTTKEVPVAPKTEQLSGTSAAPVKGDIQPQDAKSLFPGLSETEASAVQKIMDSLDPAQKAYNTAQAARKQETASRFARAGQNFQDAGGGREGFYAKFKALGGKKTGSEWAGANLTDEEAGSLHNLIENSSMQGGEKFNTQNAIEKYGVPIHRNLPSMTLTILDDSLTNS